MPQDERAAFLDRACDGDRKLRQKIEDMLQSDRDAPDYFLEPPKV